MKIILVVLAGLLLAGCNTTSNVIATTKLEVVVPDRSLFKCESVRYPNYKTLTDSQVARLIADLHTKHRECKNSLNAIQKFLEEAKAAIE
jgi:uncharacterized lipoprotein YajG